MWPCAKDKKTVLERAKIFARGLKIPLLQGGMGVAISLGVLAGTVASFGAMGTVSAVIPGYDDPGYARNPQAVNRTALGREVRRALEIADGNGVVAVNVMCALTDYEGLVKAAVDAGAQAIVCGAGLPLGLPGLVEDPDVMLAPIVSSARAARVISDKWQRNYERRADFMVVEGPLAGGHLGFKPAELTAEGSAEGTAQGVTLTEILTEVVAWRDDLEREEGVYIPLFAAGGIRTAAEAAELMALGADGIQVGTPFIATVESNASAAFKEHLIAASSADVQVIQSPVGMPGRALDSPLLRRIATEGRQAPSRCYNCLKMCDPKTTLYCIQNALVAAVRGDADAALFFSGSDIDGIDRITTVREVIANFFPEEPAVSSFGASADNCVVRAAGSLDSAGSSGDLGDDSGTFVTSADCIGNSATSADCTGTFASNVAYDDARESGTDDNAREFV